MTATPRSTPQRKRLFSTVGIEEFDALAQVARAECRTPDQQATYLLRRAMRETGIYPSPSLNDAVEQRREE